MAVKGKKSRRQRLAEHAAALAPPEEKQAVAAAAKQGAGGNGGDAAAGKGEQANAPNSGAIVVDTARLNLPKGFLEENAQESRTFKIEPVGLVILLAALAFIAFIAYLISVEPPK